MRISDLLGRRVVDVDGSDVGEVRDVRLVQDGPLEGVQAALRLDGLVVGGHGALSVRLGYHRNHVRGPALLRTLFTTLERRARYVPWPDVILDDDGPVRLRRRAADLASLDEVT